jgi:hypothetical protein
MFGPMADEIGEHLRLKTNGYLNRNRTETMNRAAEMVAASGRSAHEVPLRTALPLLQGASLESDESLREHWAALLANASTAGSPEMVPPVYASILSNLTPMAARALQILAEHTTPQEGQRRISEFSERGGMRADSFGYLLRPEEEVLQASWPLRLRDAGAIPDILVREGLASMGPTFRYAGEILRGEPPKLEVDGMEIRITQLGLDFLAACTAPGRDDQVA